MENPEFDFDRLIEIMEEQYFQAGMEPLADLKEQTQKLIESMPEAWRLRFANVMSQILPAETLRATQEKILRHIASPEEASLLLWHYRNLKEIHSLIVEMFEAIQKRSIH